jgi:hypothetical protein
MLGKSSHPGQEKWSGFASESIFHSLNQPKAHVPLLAPAGFHHR